LQIPSISHFSSQQTITWPESPWQQDVCWVHGAGLDEDEDDEEEDEDESEDMLRLLEQTQAGVELLTI
jgi:hypothetical protein